jgi:SAM-dependent methyltransferase
MWDSVATGWDTNAEFVDRHLALATQRLLDAAKVDEGDAVLDLAAGPGGAGLAAAERVGPKGKVVLSDSAREMIAVAARRTASNPRIETAVFDQDDIAFEDESFDAVISRHGLMFVEDTAGAVREAVRVLRAGGRYAAMTWGPREENPWLGVVLDAVGEQFGVPFPPPNVRGPFSLDDPGLLATALEAGGLTDVQVEALETPMRSTSLQAWWKRVPELAGPLAIALAGMEQEVRKAIEQRALRAGEAVARPDGEEVVFGGSVLIAAGAAGPRS